MRALVDASPAVRLGAEADSERRHPSISIVLPRVVAPSAAGNRTSWTPLADDYYDLLGVSRDASEEEIRRAYREKASEYHPDVSDDPDADEKFKRFQEAKEVLTDEEKRRAYDRLGHERFRQAEKRGGFDDGDGFDLGEDFFDRIADSIT